MIRKLMCKLGRHSKIFRGWGSLTFWVEFTECYRCEKLIDTHVEGKVSV